jgi:hypothetical protein
MASKSGRSTLKTLIQTIVKQIMSWL